MLDDRPDLDSVCMPFWNAYHILSRSRSIGMSSGPIPLSEYEVYFRIFRIDGWEEQLEYIKFVGALDSAYLDYQHKESKRKKSSGNKNAASANRVPRKK